MLLFIIRSCLAAAKFAVQSRRRAVTGIADMLNNRHRDEGVTAKYVRSLTALALTFSTIQAASAAPIVGSTVTVLLTNLLPTDYTIRQFANPAFVGNGTEFTGSYHLDNVPISFGITADFDAAGVLIAVTGNPGDNVSNTFYGIGQVSLTSASGLFPAIKSTNFTCCGYPVKSYLTSATKIPLQLFALYVGDTFRFDFAKPETSAPEPSSWFLMIIGFGLTGAAMQQCGKARLALV